MQNSLLDEKNLRILLIQFRPAGDIILLTPVIREIKKKFPDARLTFMINEKEQEILASDPRIDDFIKIQKIRKRSAGFIKYICYTIRLIFNTRKRKFHIVIDFIGNPKSSQITLLSGAPLRIGRSLGPRSIAYNRIVRPEQNTATIFRRLAHLSPLGIKTENAETELHLSRSCKDFARDYIKGLNIPAGRKIIMLAPNSPRPSRKWKGEYFSTLGKELVRKYNAVLLLLWGPGEEEYTRKILQDIEKGAFMIPPTSLTQMAAIISYADLLITNTSGAQHMANALGVRTITIYGPASPFVWNHPDFKKNPALYADVPCIFCEKNQCPLEEQICMTKITPAMVMKTVEKTFSKY